MRLSLRLRSARSFLKVLYRNRTSANLSGLDRVLTINTLTAEGKPQFIHSATYEELVAVFGLTPSAIANTVQRPSLRIVSNCHRCKRNKKSDRKDLT